MRGKDGQNGVKTHQNLLFFTYQILGAGKDNIFSHLVGISYFYRTQLYKTLQWIQTACSSCGIWGFCWTGVHFSSTNSAINSWLGNLIKPSITKKSQSYGHFPYPLFGKPSFSKSAFFIGPRFVRICLALYFMAMHCRDCNALQQYCLSLTHTQWQCKSSVCRTKQAQLTVGWVGEPDKPNPANPQKLIGSVSPFSQVDSSQQWSAFFQLAHPPAFGAC